MVGLAVAVMAAGCISSPTEPQEQGPVTEPTSVMISPEQLTTTGGTLERFSAEVLDAEGQPISGTSVTWKTDKPSVAIVDTDGYVWTFTEGTAMATADFPGKGRGSTNGNAYGHSKKDATVSVTQVAPDRPAQVTDLSVESTTISSATLSFTEVDDGTGAAADYIVRFQVAPLDWGTATNVQSGTCSAPMDGGSTGSTRSCTVTNLTPDTNYQFQLVAFRGSYPSDVVYGDLSNKASGSTPAEPEPTQQPQPSSGGSEGHPNEPANFSFVSQRSFDQVGEDAWSDQTGNDNYSVGVSDTGAPSGTVGRVRYPAGLAGGRSPVATATRLSFDGRSSVYVSFWIKFDANWQGHDSGVNKILYLTDPTYGGAGDPIYVAAYGWNDGAMHLQVRLQGPGGESSLSEGGNLRPNVGAGEIVRGRWHQVELVFVMNTGTNFDGQTHGWLDGSKVIEYTDVKYVDDGSAAHVLDNVRWGPVWGGTGDAVDKDMYMYMDDIYVSTN
jgi:hypothetical protein